MDPSYAEMEQDLAELQKILKLSLRPAVRQLLANEISSLQAKLPEKEVTIPTEKLIVASNTSSNSCYTIKISKYAIDESLQYMKIYCNVPEIETLSKENISCEFTETSFKFLASNLNGKNHLLHINALARNIDPSGSSYKIKNGEFIVLLKKALKGEKWDHLLLSERKTKEASDDKYKDTAANTKDDPQAGIMSMMKKMYDEGDDEMKRMIKKTWSETQDKKGTGGMPGMPTF